MLVSPFHFMGLDYSLVSIFILVTFSTFLGLKIKFSLKHWMSQGLFISLLMLNFSGLVPFFWALTSYFWCNMLVSVLIWALFMTVSGLKNFKTTLSSLLPMNSPKLLWVFLIYLESLSQLMRPLTLSLRLTCNILTGHVLLNLLMNSLFMPLLIFILFFEVMVSLIQTMVFSLLVLMYKLEFE